MSRRERYAAYFGVCVAMLAIAVGVGLWSTVPLVALAVVVTLAGLA